MLFEGVAMSDNTTPAIDWGEVRAVMLRAQSATGKGYQFGTGEFVLLTRAMKDDAVRYRTLHAEVKGELTERLLMRMR